ncbi:hypothetical protein BH10PLA2_BH10PLA2_00630 [soil metagenome]
MTAAIVQTSTENLDWTIDWSTRGIDVDTISTSEWAVTSGAVTLSDKANTATTTTVWVTGGIAGAFYTLTNTITTSGGRTLQESVIYNCIAQRLI